MLAFDGGMKTYRILAKQLGEDNSLTKDLENWLNTFNQEQQLPFL
jgi:hypothetical protein